ncbi:MAG: pyruvate kinase [Sandaracinaceae bacterium]|nr:pyruvate kinase [Sandaracinaceae bacterium]
MRRAKIVCTLGPSVSSPEMMDKIVAAGMDCARLNFSHGTHESHAAAAKLVRDAAAKARRPLAILADLCGPKMRVGRFVDGKIELAVGQKFTLTSRDVPGTSEIVSQTYEPLGRDVQPGTIILLDDGLLRLRVLESSPTDVLCEVEIGGELSDKKGMNIPGANLSTPALTPKDRADLLFAVETLKVDYLALSFVRRPEDVAEAQAIARGTPVIAKIEKPEAIDNLAAILDQADGAMVARGDLGVEIGSEFVPLLQKRIIHEVNARGKLVITATQMLDSMIRNPRPTRAEAADVANAVLDNTDAVMLSGESASGKYPIEAVSMMDAIVREVEREMLKADAGAGSLPPISSGWKFNDAAARATARLSYLLDLKAIVTFTRDGRTARLLSENRPRAPVVAVTSSQQVATRLALHWGVVPRLEIPPEDLEETLRIATSVLAREKLCKQGDAFAMVFGWPLSTGTNTIKLHRM